MWPFIIHTFGASFGNLEKKHLIKTILPNSGLIVIYHGRIHQKKSPSRNPGKTQLKSNLSREKKPGPGCLIGILMVYETIPYLTG